ncbi:unnamed protein product [Calypogeia fissa]
MNDAHELFPVSVHNRDKPPGKIGGCVGTFLQLFDWNPRKRLFSTKRLPAERPVLRKASSTKKKFKDERMPVAKLLLLAEEENRGGFPSPKKSSSGPPSDSSNAGAPGKRVPGVVARLMGLESLPDEGVNDGRLSPQHTKMLPPVEVRPLQELLHTRQDASSLSDLIRERDYLEAKKLALTDRLHVPVPGFVKKLPDPVPHSNYIPPKDGFKKSLRSDPHIQPYADHKFQKSLRPLKRAPRDLTDPKNLILALSPRASGDTMRPILLPSKVHNKLMNSPVKSPTKMGSRSARLLEAAVKILEPSMQSSTTRARVPPARPASVRDYKDSNRDGGMEERRDKLSMIDRKVALSSNAARALKGQSMNRSWNGNGREELAGRNNHHSSSFHDSASARKRNDLSQGSHAKGAAPMRAANRNRTGKGVVPHEETNSPKVAEEIKTVVPQGFEETYGGGLKPLNVGRREETRLDKFDVDDRRVSEKHVVSTLSSLSSLSVSNSPYSECSERSSTSSTLIQDSLRRSGSVKDSGGPHTPTVSKSRFMRSKSVKDEKTSKLGSGSCSSTSGSQGLYSRNSTRETTTRVKQEIPQQAHQLQQQARHQAQSTPAAVPAASVESQDSPRPQVIESVSTEKDIITTQSTADSSYQEPETKKVPEEEKATDDGIQQLRESPTVPQSSPKVSPPDVEMPAEESVSSSTSSSQTTSTSPATIVVVTTKETQGPRSNSVGGLLSYSRLFGSRKSGDRKSDRKEKKGQQESSRKSETSLVRTLLRRKSSPPPSPSSPTPAPVQSMEKPKKRGAKGSMSEPPSREMSDAEQPGYYSEDYALDADFDLAAAIQSKLLSDRNDEPNERIIHPDGELSSPSKSVDDVFPVVPSDKGCLRLLDGIDERGPRRLVIEGFDCVEEDEDETQDRFREGLFSYASHLMDDLKLEEMFSTGTAMQGSGRNGFSYSPLVDLDEPPRSSLESFSLEAGAEIEKCVSFLGRTVSSPEMSFIRREMLSQEAEGQDNIPKYEQRSRSPLGMDSEADGAAIEDAKATLLNELTEARKIVDDALEEATERVAKKLANKGRVVLSDVDGDEAVCASVVGNDDCGQPSPVSVLDCPFEEDESRSSQGNVHESICETEGDFDEDDEDSVMDDLLVESATTVGPRKDRKVRRKVSPLNVKADVEDDGKSQTEKIVDAILDISRIRCIDPSECGLVVEHDQSFQEEEEEYVRKIISVWEVFPEASGTGGANNAELPIASTLFDRLESQGRASAWKREKDREDFGSPEEGDEGGGLPRRSLKQWQGLWLHRRLIFDCVNESLAYSLKTKYPDPWLGIPILRQQPKGTSLVKEVYSEMKEWRDVQVEELDTVIEMDMCRGFGNWCNLNQEIGEIGLEIERTLLRVMIEELVSEIMGLGCSPKLRPAAAALRA